MRFRLLNPLMLLLAIAIAGCGVESSKTITTKAKESGEPVAANQQDVSDPVATPDNNPQESTTKGQKADVREVGPPEQTSDEGSTDLQESLNNPPVESPLRDIPPPTEEEPEPVYVEKQTIEIPKNWTRITPVGSSEVWVDVKAKQVMVAGAVCLDRGGLEMFVCPFNTKEHESVIAVNSRSFEVHGALLAMGATPGKPVQWHPEYVPATGPVIAIDVMWKDPGSENIVVRRAQEMVRNFKTKKPLEFDWVFGGSVLETDEETGESFYYGDGGELVCVSNFSTATMDIPVESSQAAGELLYEANPDAIPTPGTKVYVIFKPQLADERP